MKLNHLALTTLTLFLISLGVFYQDQKRGEIPLEGSNFLKSFNVTKVHKVEIRHRNSKKISLLRDGRRFVLDSHSGFPADNPKVNELFFKLSNIKLKEKVGQDLDVDDLKGFELAPDNISYEVSVFDQQDNKIHHFLVGKSWKGKGRYLYNPETKEVFLSKESLWFSPSFERFISKNLLEVDGEVVEAIASGKELIKEENQEAFKKLKRIDFEKFFSPTEKEVSDLKFTTDLQVKLDNKLVYDLKFAKKDKKFFVKARALVEEANNTFVVRQDDSADKLMEIESVVESQGAAQQFNRDRAAWVYQISEDTYKTWTL